MDKNYTNIYKIIFLYIVLIDCNNVREIFKFVDLHRSDVRASVYCQLV